MTGRAGVCRADLLDLRFLELDVLARDRVVLLENQLFCRRARVLLRHVEEAGAGGRQELDLLRYGLSHGEEPSKNNEFAFAREARNILTGGAKSSRPVQPPVRPLSTTRRNDPDRQ
jgi:hypothetical protein